MSEYNVGVLVGALAAFIGGGIGYLVGQVLSQ